MANPELEQLTPEERERQEKAAVAADLRRSIGARCELRSQDNNLIFLGRVKEFDGTALTIISETGRELPPVIFNTEFKITIRMPGRQAVVWRGVICGSSPTVWKLDQLDRFHYSEHRSHFRQPVAIPAHVTPVENLTALSEVPFDPCTVLDISLGGLQLRCTQRYERGLWLRITDACLDPQSKQPFTFNGQVCWADRVSGNAFLYGLRFTNMGMKEQDRLCSAIFTLQRMDLQAHLE